jgi:hypothetical protein
LTVNLPFDLQNGENVLLFTRRHWIYLWSRLALAFVYGAIPIAALTWLAAATSGLGSTFGRLVLILDLAWLLLWLVRGYFTWYRYQHDIWVVTNQRIVDSVKRHWFHHRMASADLVDIEDIAVVREGVLGTMFNFGDLRCQTAGEVPNFILAGIPGPSNVLGVVDAARDTARRELGRLATTSD